MKTNYMTNQMGLLVLCFLLACLMPSTSAQVLAFNQDNNSDLVQQDALPLATFLKNLEREHQVRFNYASKLMNDKFVSLQTQASSPEELDQQLEKVLTPLGLTYEKFNTTTYGIFPAKQKSETKSRKEKREIKRMNLSGSQLLTGASTSPNVKRVKAPQDQPVSGKVLDAEGNPLVGATVLVKNTQRGVLTDERGEFTISVPEGSNILLVSYLGFITQEISIDGKSKLEIRLGSDQMALSEVVVIGYGAVKRSDLTGAVGSIDTKDIVRSNPVQAAAAIQGQIAGVNIQKVKGRPGDGYSIDIRGLSNFDENNEGLNEPLVVIDGVMGGNMNNLNPNDIETINVLKDASSTAIYGSRGANGVILITTKRGVAGKTRINYSGYVGVKAPAHIPKMMTAQQFYNTYNVERVAAGGSPRGWTSSEVANAESGRTVDWIDMVTDPATQTSHTISLTGGNESTTYDFSAGYLNEGGNTLNTGFERYTIKGGMESKIGDFVKAGFTTYLTYSETALSSTEALRSAYRSRPTGTNLYADLLNPAESSDLDWNGYAVWMGISDKQVLHPMVEIDPENFRRERRSPSLLANAFVEIAPIKGLTLRSSISSSISNERVGDYRGTFTKSQKTTRAPKASLDTENISSYTWDNILTYNKSLGKHDFTVTGLHSLFYLRRESSFTDVDNLPFASLWYNMGTGNITGFGTDLQERALISYMGRLNYTFNDKYLFTVTGRTDGASQLSEDNKWAFFPSAAVAWRAGAEPFIQNLNVFSNLKLRLSYGVVGNAAVSPYQTQANIVQSAYDFGGSPAYGFSINNLANRDLVWEKSREVNLGIDMGFFDGRISAGIELYKRNTEDLILPDKTPTSTGFSDVIANVGEIENKGIEVVLNTVNIAKKDFRWSTTITITSNQDKVVKLADGQTEDVGNLRFVGESVKPIYSWEFDGIWQTSEADIAESFGQEPGHVKLVDHDGDGQITPDDRVILGSQAPSLLMGIRNQVNYKNFDLSFFVYTRQGVMYYNSFLAGTFGDLASDRYNRSSELDYWTSNNPSNTFYGLLGPGLESHSSRGNTRRALTVSKADFWRISDVTVGYTLPQKSLDRLGVANIRVYGQVSNPFVFTDFLGFNPEYNSGVNDDDVPFATYLFGVNLSL